LRHPPTPALYSLSLHDALPSSLAEPLGLLDALRREVGVPVAVRERERLPGPGGSGGTMPDQQDVGGAFRGAVALLPVLDRLVLFVSLVHEGHPRRTPSRPRRAVAPDDRASGEGVQVRRWARSANAPRTSSAVRSVRSAGVAASPSSAARSARHAHAFSYMVRAKRPLPSSSIRPAPQTRWKTRARSSSARSSHSSPPSRAMSWAMRSSSSGP